MATKPASFNATLTGWSIEARSASRHPESINNQLFDERWATVRTITAPLGQGVPTGSAWDDPWLQMFGLKSYAAAQALRWWLHANYPNNYCLETRLVKHVVTCSASSVKGEAYAVIGHEDSSAVKPIEVTHAD